MTSEALKAQYKIIKRIIDDPEEATATVSLFWNQRPTRPFEPAPGNYMTVIFMLSYPFIGVFFTFCLLKVSKNQLQLPRAPLDVEILSCNVIEFRRILYAPKFPEHRRYDGNTLPKVYSG
jgi:hypothetical protein